MSTVATAHIHLDESRVAWIDDSNVKVMEVVLDNRAHGWSPEEIYFQHNGYLSLAQIHAALSWYYDHQADFEKEIEEDLRKVEAMKAQAGESPFRRRLRLSGRLP